MSEQPSYVQAPRPDDDPSRPLVYFLCTGNAARSVMGSAMMRVRLGAEPRVSVDSGGTHVLPGQIMSVRTRTALEGHGIRDPFHRSRQLTVRDIERATVILRWNRITFAGSTYASRGGPDHRKPQASVRDLTPPDQGPLSERVLRSGWRRSSSKTGKRSSTRVGESSPCSMRRPQRSRRWSMRSAPFCPSS